MYAGGWCVSVTDTCLWRVWFFSFFFTNHKCFHNQPGNKPVNTHVALRAIMTWLGRWHQSHGQKAVGESRSDGGKVQDVFSAFAPRSACDRMPWTSFSERKTLNDVVVKWWVICLLSTLCGQQGNIPSTCCRTVTDSTNTLMPLFHQHRAGFIHT